MKSFYIAAAIVGTVIPWYFFGSFFALSGVDVILFVKFLFATGPAAGFSADIVISIAVFWVWSYVDAQRHDIRKWWLVLPAGCFVGLSLAMPVYLYLREDKTA